MPGTLIIGYGNLLRGDDAVGCRAAYKLEQRFHGDPDVEVIAAQQLTPEMADDIARHSFVLFLMPRWERSRERFDGGRLLPSPAPVDLPTS